MAFLAALWLPILLSRFSSSSPAPSCTCAAYHRNDYRQIPDEDKVLAAARSRPHAGFVRLPVLHHKDMKSPALVEKQKQGPVGS